MIPWNTKTLIAFRVIRFEDFIMAINKSVEEVLQFYGLSVDSAVLEYLETHTKEYREGEWQRTYRNSSVVPFQWMKELTFTEVQEIQNNCKEAMMLWGYREANSSQQLQENFTPYHPFNDFD
jgi:hypothetical protein